MVAIDNSYEVPSARAESSHTAQFVLFAALSAALLAAVSLTTDTGFGTGWRVAAEMVGRLSLILFVAAMTVEPISRILPFKGLRNLGRERGNLILAFAMASIVSLVCVLAPAELGSAPLSAPAIAYCAMTGLILVVMLFSGHPATMRFLGGAAWRAMQRVATAYFWVAFTLIGLDHIVGPHRPDSWYGFSLMLLVGALLVRFLDQFVGRVRNHMLAGKVA